MILHLDKHFKPFQGQEINFEQHTFAGGEPHIKINPDFDLSQAVNVSHRLNSFNNLGLLCMAVDALKRLGCTLNVLFIPYFPAARQDRLMVTGEPLSVKVYADIINAFQFKKVVIYDVHSEVTSTLLHNCKVVPNHNFIQTVLEKIDKELLLISPDAGALKKIHRLAEHLGGIKVVTCSKNRDVRTGALKNFKVDSDDLEGKDCLLVDDICDGGGTFLGLAKALKEKNAGKLYLAVSHGIFSKGYEELLKHFEKIFTTDSIRTINEDKIEQLKLTL